AGLGIDAPAEELIGALLSGKAGAGNAVLTQVGNAIDVSLDSLGGLVDGDITLADFLLSDNGVLGCLIGDQSVLSGILDGTSELVAADTAALEAVQLTIDQLLSGDVLGGLLADGDLVGGLTDGGPLAGVLNVALGDEGLLGGLVTGDTELL